MKIGIKIVIFVILVLFSAMAFLSWLSFTQGSKIIQERVSDQLNSINVLKQNQLLDFISEKKTDLESIAIDSFVISNIEEMLPDNNIDHPFSESHLQVKNIIIEKSQIINNDFSEIFMLDLKGFVHISTLDKEEGKIKSNQIFFREGKRGTYVESYVYDIAAQKPIIVISTPIINQNKDLMGVLVGKVNLDSVSDIMTERSGLGQTGETILVNKNNLLVTKSRFIEGLEFKKSIHAQAVKNCLKKESGTKRYLDYREEPAIIRYEWLEDLQVCLIAKIDEKEAFKPIVELRNTILIGGILISLLFILIGYFYSRSFTKPIKKLVEATKEIATGNFDHKVSINTKDELQLLGKSFNDIGIELKKARIQEKEYHHRLENEVQEKTKKLNSKMEELEKFNKLAIGRELKMIDLKKKLKELEKK